MKYYFSLLQVIIAAIAIISTADAQIITNGGFENGSAGWTFSGTLSVGTTSYGGEEGNSATIWNPGQNAGDGILSQSFATTIGQQYQLSLFAVAIAAQQALQVEVIGNTSLLNVTINPPGTGLYPIQPSASYQQYTYQFTADSTSSLLKFTDLTTTANSFNNDSVIDNISVISVPEPSALFMLLACSLIGFGLILREGSLAVLSARLLALDRASR